MFERIPSALLICAERERRAHNLFAERERKTDERVVANFALTKLATVIYSNTFIFYIKKTLLNLTLVN